TMGGMLGGLGGGVAGAPVVGASRAVVGSGGIVANNTNSALGTSPPVSNLLSSNIFKSLFGALADPEGTAAKMAEQGVSPEDFEKTKQSSLSSVLQPSPRAAPAGGNLASLISPTSTPPAPGGAPPSKAGQIASSPILQGRPTVVGGGSPRVVGGSEPVVGGSPPVSGLGNDLGRLMEAIFGPTGAAVSGTPQVVTPPAATSPVVTPPAATVPPASATPSPIVPSVP